jgi:serine/threonine-protein kinase RsbW
VPSSRCALHLDGRATPECLELIHQALAELWAGAPQVSDLDRYMFATALLEVASNTLAHGGAGETRFWLTLSVDADHIRGAFSDDGAEVDLALDAALPEDEYAECGRGLAMARMALTEFGYRREDGRNCWQLVRDRDREPEV